MKVNRCIFPTSEKVANIGEYPRLPIFLLGKLGKRKITKMGLHPA